MSKKLHNIEDRAAEATNHDAFNCINFSGVRDGVEKLLSTIGKTGFFSEYTDHSFAHATAMINMLEWLLIDDAKENMSPADWLTLVLGIYFHDLGMVVTKDEFDARHQSEFSDFCKRVLFAGDDGTDYESKVEELGEEEAEKFLYEEFVREHHAERVRRWIVGDHSPDFGVATAMCEEVNNLLGSVDAVYKEDLAQLCASHHAQDISNLSPSKPYGDSDDETVNLHFLGVVLRVVDLLQVTKQRTPGIVFRVINPRDPISQVEWKKQSAVRRVRPSTARDTDGNEVQSDTVEIHATFDEPSGYFGLTSYIKYAKAELARCAQWVEVASVKYARPLPFPWRKIDDSRIEARGFLKDAFKFELDNSKILDLLTGHTLYNDSSVVVRELAQNAIDAVRLQFGADVQSQGKVHLSWDSNSRTLTVTDNGTGMTQREIVENLLKVGASRYQDTDFKRKHPDFSSISRFGIGILSAFMVADEVTITTVSSEEKARRLTLKSVHGNYLIELLDKSSVEVDDAIRAHGTQIKLTMRPSAKIEKLDKVTRRFVFFPKCKVVCTVDSNEPVEIGFSDTKAGMERMRASVESDTASSWYASKTQYRVVTQHIDGIDVSFLVKKWPYSDTWSLVFGQPTTARPQDDLPVTIGVCVEGIFVRPGIPGFASDSPACLVNASGKNAPHANVARNDFEFNKNYLKAIAAIYEAFATHVKEEFDKTRQERSRSLTHASNEATFMISRLLARDFKTETERRVASQKLLALQVLAVENNGERKTISFEEAASLSEIRLVECPFFRAAETAIAELESHSSISKVVSALDATEMKLDPDATYIVGGLQVSAQRIALSGWQISRLILAPGRKRIDAIWTKSNDALWYSYKDEDLHKYNQEYNRIGSHFEQYGVHHNRGRAIAIGTTSVDVESIEDSSFGIVVVGDQTLILPQAGVSEQLIEMFDKVRSSHRPDLAAYLFGILHILDSLAAMRRLNRPEESNIHRSFLGRVFAGEIPEREKALRFLLGFEQTEPPDDAMSIAELMALLSSDRLEVLFAAEDRYPTFW